MWDKVSRVCKMKMRIYILIWYVICAMLLGAFGKIFFSSLLCVGMLCVWGASIFNARCPTPDPKRQMLQDCKTCNCRVFLEFNANHTSLCVCVCVCVCVFHLFDCPSTFFCSTGSRDKLVVYPDYTELMYEPWQDTLRTSGCDLLKQTRRSRKDFNLNSTSHKLTSDI